MARAHSLQGGFVMVTAIIVLLVTVLVSFSAVTLTVARRAQALRVDRVQRAQQAADAGVQATVYQLNQAGLQGLDLYGAADEVAQHLACLPLTLPAPEGTAVFDVATGPVGTTPCPQAAGAVVPGAWQPVGQHASYRTTLVAHDDDHGRLNPVVVSIGREDAGTPGAADDVVRRVAVRLASIAPFNMIEAGRDLELRGSLSSSRVRVTNGDLSAKRDLKISGRVAAEGSLHERDGSVLRPSRFEYGEDYVGTTVDIGPDLVGPPDAAPPDREPISISPAKPECAGGPCPPGHLDGAKMLVATSGTVTLAAGDHVTCGVRLGKAVNLVTATTGPPTRLYVDSPTSARCAPYAGTAGLGSLVVEGTQSTGADPSALQLYVVGGAVPGSTVAHLGPSSANDLQALSFFLYAPTSAVELRYAAFTGSIIGHDVLLHSPPSSGEDGVALLTQDLALSRMATSNAAGVFRAGQYVECAPAPPPDALMPDAAC